MNFRTLSVWPLLLLAVLVQAAEDPYAQIAAFDGQNRAGVQAVWNETTAAVGDAAKLATIEAKLVAILEQADATPAGKQEACRLLLIVGGKAAVPALAKLLPDPFLGNAARYGLERNPSAEAGKALREAIGSTTGLPRAGVINSVGDRRDAAAVPLLAPLVTDGDAVVAQAAVTALGKIGTPEAVTALGKAPAGLVTGQALALAGDQLAAAGKAAAAEAVYLGLTAAAQPAPVRAAGLRGLAAVKSTKALDLAIKGLTDDDRKVRQVSARLALTLTDKTTASRYLAAYPTLFPETQLGVLAAFAERGDPAAGKLALEALKSPDAGTRGIALVIAAASGTADLVAPLVELGIKADRNEQRSIKETLTRFKGIAGDVAMLDVLKNGSPEAKQFIVGPVADRGMREAVPTLLADLTGPDLRLAREVVRGVPRVFQPADVPKLITAILAIEDGGVRGNLITATLTVARTGDPAKVSQWIADASAAAPPAKQAILLALLPGIGTDAALAQLVAAAKSTDPTVQKAAIDALATDWEDARALAPLLALAKDVTDEATSARALSGYLRLVAADDKMAPADRARRLGEALAAARRPDEKRTALMALRACRVPEAVEAAAKQLDDPKVFLEAAGCVIYLAGPRREGNRNLPAVTGPATKAALEKVIELAKDELLKDQAKKLL